LGLFVQTIASAFRGFSNTLEGTSHFAYHFSPILYLCAPLLWVSHSALALVGVQAVATALIAPALYAIARKRTGDGSAAALACIALLYPPLQGVTFTDFHEAAFAPAAVAWLLWALDARRFGIAALLLASVLCIKEDQAPAMAFLGVAGCAYFGRRGERAGVAFCAAAVAAACAVFWGFFAVVRPLAGAPRAVSRRFDAAGRLLGLAFHIVRHEDVVAEFDREVRTALEFIGLDWDPAVRDFAARGADAKTPSAGQLARGLNAEGVGAWKRYAGQMAPALPILAPWVERFGYLPAEPDAHAADPRLPAVLAEVNAAVRAGDWPRAFTLMDGAFANGLRHPFFHRLRAMRAQQAGRLDEAIAHFETAMAHSPADFATLSALGDCLTRSGRPADGLDRLDTSIALNPTFAPAHGYRGRALEAMGDVAGARAARGRALAIDPRHAQALGNLAALAAHAADWTQARRLAVRALEIDPSQAVAAAALAAAQVAEDAGQTRETF